MGLYQLSPPTFLKYILMGQALISRNEKKDKNNFVSLWKIKIILSLYKDCCVISLWPTKSHSVDSITFMTGFALAGMEGLKTAKSNQTQPWLIIKPCSNTASSSAFILILTSEYFHIDLILCGDLGSFEFFPENCILSNHQSDLNNYC